MTLRSPKATQAKLDELDTRLDTVEGGAGAGGGPLDSDLTVIAGLNPSNDDVIQRKAGAWTNRTPNQLKTDLGLGSVDNTSDSAKPVSTAQQTALNAKAPLASPAFTGTPTGITKTHVGLGNVDNTADTAKPVSAAQQTALDLKAPLASPAFTGTPTGITKTHVGLGNVANAAQVQLGAIDAKGDLLAGTADDTIARLAVGSDGQVLTADSAQTTGVKWATVSGGGGSGAPLTATSVKTSSYTAVSGDLVRVDASAGAVTITLPAAAAGQLVAVKKVDSSTNAVTIARAGSDTIDGATSATLSLPNSSRVLTGLSGAWLIHAAHIALSSLDARYVDVTNAQTVAGVKTFSAEPVAPSFKTSGITGAANASRHVGATVSGAPTSGTFAVGDFVVTQNGNVWICTVAGTPGTWTSPRELSNLLDSGEEVFDRDRIGSLACTYANQQLRLSYFTARKTETTTQVRTYSGSTAFSATPTLCKVGLYLIDGNGDGTLVAATANDTTMWAGVSTGYTRSWATSYSKIAGQRYALAVVVNSSAAVGTFTGINWSSLAPVPVEAALSPRLSGVLSSQTDLPSTFTNAALSISGTRFYGVVLP